MPVTRPSPHSDHMVIPCFSGPMGVFEMASFETGTKAMMDTIVEVTKSGTVTVIGGLTRSLYPPNFSPSYALWTNFTCKEREKHERDNRAKPGRHSLTD